MSPDEPTLQDRGAAIARAFDGEAERYERFENHPSARMMRQAVHRAYERYLRPGGSVLDLNCGPGPDLPFFQSLGMRVTAIDISMEMLEKARMRNPEANLLHMDFNDLDRLDRRFDAICSNFGGLNTQPGFEAFADSCWQRLNLRGFLIINIMTRIPLPEIAEGLLRGRHFFRRLRHGGHQELKVGNRILKTWYFHPGAFYRLYFRQRFELLEIRGLGVFLPPAYFPPPPRLLIRTAGFLDRALGGWFPFNRLGDHALLVMRARAARS